MALSNDELACVYASLILADDSVDIRGDKIASILKAANYEIESYWPGLFAGALEGVEIMDLIRNVGSAPATTSVAAPVAAAPAAAADDKKAGGGKEASKKEEKKPEKDDSDDGDDMGFGLFD